MKKFVTAAAHRLRGQGGESIAEVLIAVLISAVAMVMLASMIITAGKLVSDSRTKLTAYYAQNEALTKRESGSFATAVLKKGNENVAQYTVQYLCNPEDTKVIVYWK